MKMVQYITESNKEKLNKSTNTDQVYYSELNEWYTTNAFRSLSIKYVLDGSIYYKPGKKEYKVGGSQFLVATQRPGVKAYFGTTTPVKSLCIDICEDTLGQALSVLEMEKKNEITDFNTEKIQNSVFLESMYAEGENTLGKRLVALAAEFRQNPGSAKPVTIQNEWFLEMVELIILSGIKNHELLNKLSALKTSTRKEIVKRINTGKEFIDMNFFLNPDIMSVARECNMSVFHFYRCFKQLHGISPYQYMLGKRLDYARDLLLDRTALVSDIAVKCGFPDVFTFSKAFKRKYGFSPSKFFGETKANS